MCKAAGHGRQVGGELVKGRASSAACRLRFALDISADDGMRSAAGQDARYKRRADGCGAVRADGAAVAPDLADGASRSSTVNSELWTFKVPL